MIAYTMVGTNNLEEGIAFYAKLFEGSEVKPLFKTPRGGQFFGKNPNEPMLVVGLPYDEQPASNGNGVMVALRFETTEEVDALYEKAIAAGGADEGEPGWRLENVFYGAYFRDPDGNKICACKMNFG